MSAPTVTNPLPVPQPAPPHAKPRRRRRGRAVRISNVSWNEYEKLTEVFAERPALRLTYDNGELEIMVPSLGHDFGDRFLASLVPILARAFRVPFRPGGSVTMKSKKKLKGIEGDDVFWLVNAAQLAGVSDLNLKIHPPPDLALEVDVSHSSMNRLRIYARLNVPEVWRLEADALTFYALVGKKYEVRSHSPAFPLVTSDDLMTFVRQARSAGDQLPILDAFQTWLQQHLGTATAPPAAPPPPSP
jgi:Uma2 family endonuclease